MSDPNSIFTLSSFSGALSDLVSRTASGVVSVHSHRSRASGFVWRPGLIITANEALAEEGEIAVVLPGGEAVPATLAGRDPATDIALLRIGRADLQKATPAPDHVTAGALAIVVGAHDGAPVAALGVVSVASGGWRSLRGGEIDARIELDVSLRRSSEGAPALDATGRTFGMAVLGPRRRVLIIPSATIDRIAAKLETHGRIARGYLGLGLQSVRLDDGGVGVMVMSVDAKGPGAAAGVRQGDVIIAWNGQSIRGVQTLLRTLGPDSVGSSVRLSLKRASEPAEASLMISERPEV